MREEGKKEEEEEEGGLIATDVYLVSKAKMLNFLFYRLYMLLIRLY